MLCGVRVLGRMGTRVGVCDSIQFDTVVALVFLYSLLEGKMKSCIVLE